MIWGLLKAAVIFYQVDTKLECIVCFQPIKGGDTAKQLV